MDWQKFEVQKRLYMSHAVHVQTRLCAQTHKGPCLPGHSGQVNHLSCSKASSK